MYSIFVDKQILKTNKLNSLFKLLKFNFGWKVRKLFLAEEII